MLYKCTTLEFAPKLHASTASVIELLITVEGSHFFCPEGECRRKQNLHKKVYIFVSFEVHSKVTTMAQPFKLWKLGEGYNHDDCKALSFVLATLVQVWIGKLSTVLL